MKTIEEEVREMKITENQNEEIVANRLTKVLKGKAFKDTIQNVSNWHKRTLAEVLEKQLCYKYVDQWTSAAEQIQTEIYEYSKYLEKGIETQITSS